MRSIPLWMRAGLLLALAYTGWQVWQIGGAPYPERYDYDEGVYAETAAAMVGGARLYRDVFLSQPPLLIVALAGAYHLVGSTLAAARGVVVLFSLLWPIALLTIGAAEGRPRIGIAATCALLGTPVFLAAAHTVQMELPSEALAATAVALAVLGMQRSGISVWAAAGALGALAAMTKFTAAASVVPLVAAALMAGGGSGTARVIALAAGAALAASLFLPVIAHKEFTAEAISFHLALAHRLGPDPLGHARVILGFLADHWPLAAAGALGAGAGIVRGGRLERMLLVWLAAEGIVVLSVTPLWPHHVIVLLSPLALLAGIAVDDLAARVPQAARHHIPAVAAAACIIYLVLGGWAAGPPRASVPLEQMSAFMADSLPPGALVLTDDPMVPFLAHRPVARGFIDTSRARIWAGQITALRLLAAMRNERVQAVLFWRGTFREEFPRLQHAAQAIFPAAFRLEGHRTLLLRHLVQGRQAPR